MLITQLAVVALTLIGPDAKRADDKMPLTGLPPSKIAPDLCVLRYRISTQSPECQEYFDQGLGYVYSYVWMEAARAFETATVIENVVVDPGDEKAKLLNVTVPSSGAGPPVMDVGTMSSIVKALEAAVTTFARI